MINWLMAQSWFRSALILGAAAIAVFLFIIGQRKAGERIGAMKVNLEVANATAKTKAKMDKVPRPDKPDVVDRLRDGSF